MAGHGFGPGLKRAAERRAAHRQLRDGSDVGHAVKLAQTVGRAIEEGGKLRDRAIGVGGSVTRNVSGAS